MAPGPDTTVANDLVDVGVTPGSTALLLTMIAVVFAPSTTSNTVTKLGCFSDASSGATATGFSIPSGVTGANTTWVTTESQTKLRMRKADRK